MPVSRAALSHTAYSTTAAKRPDGSFYAGIRRHRTTAGGRACGIGHAQQFGDALGAKERRHQRFVRLFADGREHVGDLITRDVQRWDVDRDHRVHFGVIDRRVERVFEVLRSGVRAQRYRSTDDQPDRCGRVPGQQSQRVGVADDRDPSALGKRLVGQQLGNVEHLLERVDLDDAGLTEHGVDRCHRRGDRHRVPGSGLVSHRDPLRGPAGAHRDDRFAPRHPPSDPRELARVADGFEIEQDDLGGRDPLPSTARGRCPRRPHGFPR